MTDILGFCSQCGSPTPSQCAHSTEGSLTIGASFGDNYAAIADRYSASYSGQHVRDVLDANRIASLPRLSEHDVADEYAVRAGTIGQPWPRDPKCPMWPMEDIPNMDDLNSMVRRGYLTPNEARALKELPPLIPTRPQPVDAPVAAVPASVSAAAGGAEFYDVCPDGDDGCKSCGHGAQWTVCWDQDGEAHQISMSSEDQDDILYMCELMNSARELALQQLQSSIADARRYRRLRVIGCAPLDTTQLQAGTVLRFTNLDQFVDADLKAFPGRGEVQL